MSRPQHRNAFIIFLVREQPRFGFCLAFWIAVGIGALALGTRL